jgi:hydroxymethylbilane synthase
MAVHSMKDLPSVIPPELFIAAVPERLDYRDVLVSEGNLKFSDLPEKSVIGTSSLRRRAQILARRKDLIVKDIRGNLDTRLKKLKEQDYSAIVVAAAGLIRMSWQDKISEYFSPDLILPAAGQGALAIEARKNDKEINRFLEKLNNIYSSKAVTAERSFLKFLEGGCQIPVGVLAVIKDDVLALKGMVASLDGTNIFRDEINGNMDEGRELGIKLAEKLLEKGAGKVLKEIRNMRA